MINNFSIRIPYTYIEVIRYTTQIWNLRSPPPTAHTHINNTATISKMYWWYEEIVMRMHLPHKEFGGRMLTCDIFLQSYMLKKKKKNFSQKAYYQSWKVLLFLWYIYIRFFTCATNVCVFYFTFIMRICVCVYLPPPAIMMLFYLQHILLESLIDLNIHSV